MEGSSASQRMNPFQSKVNQNQQSNTNQQHRNNPNTHSNGPASSNNGNDSNHQQKRKRNRNRQNSQKGDRTTFVHSNTNNHGGNNMNKSHGNRTNQPDDSDNGSESSGEEEEIIQNKNKIPLIDPSSSSHQHGARKGGGGGGGGNNPQIHRPMTAPSHSTVTTSTINISSKHQNHHKQSRDDSAVASIGPITTTTTTITSTTNHHHGGGNHPTTVKSVPTGGASSTMNNHHHHHHHVNQHQQQQHHQGGKHTQPSTASHHHAVHNNPATSIQSNTTTNDNNTAAPESTMDERFLSELTWTDPSITPMIPTCSRAINDVFHFNRLSKVQAATLPLINKGYDIFGKAKTGGGKTLAFLIPAVEKLMVLGRNYNNSQNMNNCGILIITPTRELALQILEETKNLTKYHGGLRIQAVIGGTNINTERLKMKKSDRVPVNLDILIGTPGRLVDHVQTTEGFIEALNNLKILILDEADRLLDIGFKDALDKIASVLPSNNSSSNSGGNNSNIMVPTLQNVGKAYVRQTLLFSATVPPAVLDIAHRFLRKGYEFVDTVGNDDTQTNTNVTQEVVVVRSLCIVPALVRILSHAVNTDPNHKIIVFFSTAKFTAFMSGIFERMIVGSTGNTSKPKRFNIIEMHSRKSQNHRTAQSEKFRNGKGMIMFSSDVTARGLDYPDVSMIIQVGLTDREQYIHRLGRTARAGKSGLGLLLLADFEANALLPELQDLPLVPATEQSILTGGTANQIPSMPSSLNLPQSNTDSNKGTTTTTSNGVIIKQPNKFIKSGPYIAPVAAVVPVPLELKTVLATVEKDGDMNKRAKQSYSGWLGFYNTNVRKLRWDKITLVKEANSLFLTLGLTQVPMMSRETLGKMQLRGTPGIIEGPKGWRPNDD